MPHVARRASAVILNLAVLAVLAIGCKKPTSQGNGPDAAPTTSAASSSSSVAPVAVEPPPVVDAGPPAPTGVPKHYARVLHTGDSMVGGGLSRALGPMFVADGSKYIRDVIESGSIHEFSQNDHLPKLIKASNPDLILLSLGANHVPHFQQIDLDKEVAPFVAKLIKRVAPIDCIWIAPPIWKPDQQKFNDWLKDKVAPCKFYDGTDPAGANLVISRRADKIHPDEKGGEVWAADFWKWFKEGDGRFFVDPGTSLDAGK